ncbi:tRNA pseudouridine(38-40) synthase TruA [Bordetella avium]|uniref:tRNA pseudouridine synthase A n=1 Tax=Bordetella avium (strain 197N) TaxID=360910 RepID=TRUA_BORA1|nr:tRNA pseudouridine(38-40) synthase TruA [Bordetella avium]Q2KYM0.1 RecName: Full=tRNA pseudouridine synthase A; AltName: Full=tRNA pseudouridine(38-40) synthase; AltName: Full=tRNA pseudouridylate synthase I; AltName: Full=tRNA-uridine isomerase I [Bordetella avium 197N]AZY49562.1 tRNA pseudouridine(38-40) synthase TruA [Bordetella avium]AZY52958.1 tRNA pseudouridine(38-40) synthase TruA [Bordetella avium]RIQ11955.1 tRNA pseudouridine(38-40) synthase TruA [Bordetella avium]RIQ17739.1 tRNA p
MTRIALGLSYDGSSWQGWQTQPHGQTVQDTLEAALGQFSGTGAPLDTLCAGRTDTGVHAAMQVVHVDTHLNRRAESWVRGVNAFLPSSISIHWAKEVGEDFHARFSARSRTYVYLLWRGRVRPALWAHRAGWCFQPLDVTAMRQAAQALLGEHDFSSFRSSQCQARHPVRHLTRLDIAERGSFLVFTLQANAFLHHMVRNIMGALLQIGQGRESVDWMASLLRARDRRLGAPTFSPDGLYLSAIDYPTLFELPDLDGGSSLLAPFTA